MKADTLPCKNLTSFCSRTDSVQEYYRLYLLFFKDHKDREWQWARKGKNIKKLGNGGIIKCSKDKDGSICILLIESMLYTTFEFQSFTSKIYLCLSNISGKFPSTGCKVLLTTITPLFETIKQTPFLLTFHKDVVQSHLTSKINQLCISS